MSTLGSMLVEIDSGKILRADDTMKSVLGKYIVGKNLYDDLVEVEHEQDSLKVFLKESNIESGAYLVQMRPLHADEDKAFKADIIPFQSSLDGRRVKISVS